MTIKSYNFSPAIEFKILSLEDIPTIVAAFSSLGWVKPVALYASFLEEQSKGERNIWVAWNGNVFIGYVTLKWISAYEPFRAQKIPEIKDLNVLPQFRNQGVASKLVNLAEDAARQRGKHVGLSVGLTLDYGPAQRLYVKKGYLPDAQGVTYQYKTVPWSEWVQVDDDLVLWLVKTL